jgi:hypothetical protein
MSMWHLSVESNWSSRLAASCCRSCRAAAATTTRSGRRFFALPDSRFNAPALPRSSAFNRAKQTALDTSRACALTADRATRAWTHRLRTEARPALQEVAREEREESAGRQARVDRMERRRAVEQRERVGALQARAGALQALVGALQARAVEQRARRVEQRGRAGALRARQVEAVGSRTRAASPMDPSAMPTASRARTLPWDRRVQSAAGRRLVTAA